MDKLLFLWFTVYMSNTQEVSHEQAPTLGDVLQFQATIEAMVEATGGKLPPQQVNNQLTVSVHSHPEGLTQFDHRVVGQVMLRQKSETGHYKPHMLYMVLQDEGDQTTSHVVKRVPLPYPKKAKKESEPVTLEEVQNLGRIITETFLQ